MELPTWTALPAPPPGEAQKLRTLSRPSWRVPAVVPEPVPLEEDRPIRTHDAAIWACERVSTVPPATACALFSAILGRHVAAHVTGSYSRGARVLLGPVGDVCDMLGVFVNFRGERGIWEVFLGSPSHVATCRGKSPVVLSWSTFLCCATCRASCRGFRWLIPSAPLGVGLSIRGRFGCRPSLGRVGWRATFRALGGCGGVRLRGRTRLCSRRRRLP